MHVQPEEDPGTDTGHAGDIIFIDWHGTPQYSLEDLEERKKGPGLSA